MSLEAAESIARQLKEKPNSCLGLPTGRSPIGCYKILAHWSKEGMLDWSEARCFALDDYIDVEESLSFQTFLASNLHRHTNAKPENCFNPRFVDNYDQLIADCGGLDLVMLGLGTNGHIAFNEPGTPAESWTHCITLTEDTRRSNQEFFGSLDAVPTHAVTMGIATILASDRIVLIVSGERKRPALNRVLSGAIDINIPASHLAAHKKLKIIADFDILS